MTGTVAEKEDILGGDGWTTLGKTVSAKYDPMMMLLPNKSSTANGPLWFKKMVNILFLT